MHEYRIYITFILVFLLAGTAAARERSPEVIEGPESFIQESSNTEPNAISEALNLKSQTFDRINASKLVNRNLQKEVLKFRLQSFSNKLSEQFNVHLGLDNSFLLIRGGAVDVNSNLYQFEDIRNSYVAYETYLGFGFKARVFKKFTVQPNLSFLEYHISRYSNPQNFVLDLQYFKVRHGIFPQLRVSLGISFGAK